MSLGVIIKAPEGVVLAAESRVTLTVPQGNTFFQVPFDNATKLLSFGQKHNYVGAVTYGLASIGLRTAHSFLPEVVNHLSTKDRLPIDDFSNDLSRFYMDQWVAAGLPSTPADGPMVFLVGGYDEGSPYGRVFQIQVPNAPAPDELFSDQFGITWGGQRGFVDRLIQGYDHQVLEILGQHLGLQATNVEALRKALSILEMPLNLVAMPLQDCVDLAIFYIRTTISAQSLTVGLRGCGGPIDVAVITRQDGIKFIQKKQIRGEKRSADSVLEGEP